jgi:hypothetical protein
MTIEEIGEEIEEYLNENANGLIYTFITSSEKDEATGINELTFDVQHHIRTWRFILEHTLTQEGSTSDVHRGHIFRLKLKPWLDHEQPMQTVKNWMANDINNAEEGLNSKKSSLKRK